MQNVLNVTVSCYEDYYSPKSKPVNLLMWLRSDKHREKVERIRTIQDKTERDRLKALMPGITPSGIFTYRTARHLIKHSGLVQFDIDYKGNEHIGNFDKLKKEICNISNVAYCGLSVSGRGYWGLIPIAFPDKHREHFISLKEAFNDLGITIDASCKDVCRLRGYSYDADSYFNHAAILFEHFYIPLKPPTTPTTYYNGNGAITFDWCVEQKNKSYKFINGQRHDYILSVAGYCKFKGLSHDETLAGCLRFVQPDFQEDEIKSIVNYSYKK